MFFSVGGDFAREGEELCLGEGGNPRVPPPSVSNPDHGEHINLIALSFLVRLQIQ